MFYKKDESGYREIVDGVLMKPLVHGEKTLLIETNIKKGAVHSAWEGGTQWRDSGRLSDRGGFLSGQGRVSILKSF